MRLRFLNKTNLIILLTITMVSCKKLDLAPRDKYTDDNFWTVNANAFNALATCYSQQISGGYGGSSSAAQAYFYNEALSDNAYCPLDVNVGTPTAISSGDDANFNAGINRVKYEWASYYTNIRSCNLFLENIDKNTTLGSALIARMKGEARYLRAQAFFRLTNFFGDVPLITKVQTPDEAKVTPKTAKADVVTYILSELDAAAAVLPNKDNQAAADKGRVTIGAAKAMKARVLLYNSRWAECAAVCEDLMNNQGVNGAYALVSNFPNIFSTNNKYNSEIIFSLGYSKPNRTWSDWSDLGPFYTGAGAVAASNSNLVPTQDLVESYLTLDGKAISDPGSGYDENNAPYANRDPRLGYTIAYDKYQWVNQLGNTQTIYIKPGTAPDAANKKNEYGGGSASSSGYYWRKYFDPTVNDGFNYGEDIIIQRWAEVLLMEAEAKTMLGQMTASVWDATIKPLRTRAGFVNPLALNYPGNTNMSMTDQVRNERRSELALESLRYDDIKRWKIAETVMNHATGNEVRGAKFAANSTAFIKLVVRRFDPAKHYLWPIPTESLQTDPKLTQNPGW
ncbi:MAG: RagB/SusD family nutrient uptake outer membrane protein [Mucilaginibacter sp.]